jgi:hypothetical protein
MHCHGIWEGKRLPKCPICQAEYWSSLPTTITPKHDPRQLPSAYPGFRSTLPSDFPDQSHTYFYSIALSGTALQSPYYDDFCYVAKVPSQLNAGSAVPAGSAMPTHPMDSYVVAKAFAKEAHVYADDDSRIQGMLSSGTYQWLPTCSQKDCENLCVPDTQFCAKHSSPPLAE